jgi:hypothetical protein
MLVAQRDGTYRFVTQTAHAAVAGQFAERWGSEAFESPTPRAAVTAAAHNHDNGWWAYDRRPHLDGGEPVDFRGVPPDTWVEFYESGIDSVVGMDPYAGLLTSLHGSGLRRQRYGLAPSMPANQPAYDSFVAGEERRQRRLADALARDERLTATDEALLDALHNSGTPPAETDSRLWDNYRLLQAWDRLSLAVCGTLDPGERTAVGPVPTAAGAEETLTVEARSTEEFRVGPYPFEDTPLTVHVQMRTVAAGSFETEAELFERYYGGPSRTLAVTLCPD